MRWRPDRRLRRRHQVVPAFFTKPLVAVDDTARYQFTIRVAPGHRGKTAIVSVRKWVTKKLRPGDMTALSHILQERLDDPQPGSLDRLALRGFIKTKANSPVVTLLGRVALLLRQLTKH